jgi:hypothetical protein
MKPAFSSKFTTDGVNFFRDSAISDCSITKSGIKNPKSRPPKVENKKTFPKINSWMSVFLQHNSAILNSMPAAILQKLLSDIEELFFFWVNRCKVRKERLDEHKKRSNFFKIAQAELITVQIGPRKLTFELDLDTSNIFCGEPFFPEPTLEWMDCRGSAAVTSVVWQPIHSEIPIPTLQETLEQIAEDQAFIEGILPPQLNSESYF